MSYSLPYPEPVRYAPDGSPLRGDALEVPEVVPVEGAPAWNLRYEDGSIADCVVLRGPDGLVLVGTGEGYHQGRAIAAAIEERFDAPVRAVVYGDRRDGHCSGTRAVLAGHRIGRVPVLAHETWQERRTPHHQAVSSIVAVRAAMQYGRSLRGADDRGPAPLRPPAVDEPPNPLVPPTVTVRHNQEMTLAGLRVRFLSTGSGEEAALSLYLVDHRTAVITTDVHAAPSNLSAVEGVRASVSADWRTLLTRLSTLDIEYLVGTRLSPLRGAENIRDFLSVYHDIVDYLHDQTVRHMLAGMPFEDVVQRIPLPPNVVSGPFTRPFHGNLLGSAAQYCVEYLGWFSGNAVDMAPTPRGERARRGIALMGGDGRVLRASAEALEGGDPQWAAELARMVVEADPGDAPGRAALTRALRALGDNEANPLRRNWYHSAALEVSGELRLSHVRDALASPASLSPREILDGLRFRVAPERSAGTTVSIGVNLSDTGEHFGVRLRNSVLRVEAGIPAEWNAGIRLSRDTLVDLVTDRASLTELMETGAIEVQGVPGPVEELWDAIEPRPELSLHLR
ncbi:alkyl sulfatase dimerization domain-containing protein [Actinorugispora endophytica]|uniref:Alkyl sulfatase BDS1-like metallo-beta-lactamase superfamily hydrolase n=1 Tax=Actinorugispora endophytica TaxID=1605990 RepID=A0A4R6UEB0_9ACTN|nr:alkyl sulfatase dimerization domain-containing protein [Actinorugispora endophytica]TDQ44246.1 alkyl sulfatase BDS1-like metallo-beta-lactamase superfamily hydrolase [Actinorugispora endophytica]